MGQRLVEDRELFGVVASAHGRGAEVAHQAFVAMQHFLDLARVVGHHLGRGIDGGQAAADDPGRQPYLQVGQRGILGRAGQLQAHEEVRGLADAADQVVLKPDDRRLAGAGGQRDVIEAELPGVFERDTAAEAHAAVGAEGALAQQGEVDDLEKVLVPAHGDAVLRDAAEAAHGARVEILVERAEITHRLRWRVQRAGQCCR